MLKRGEFYFMGESLTRFSPFISVLLRREIIDARDFVSITEARLPAA